MTSHAPTHRSQDFFVSQNHKVPEAQHKKNPCTDLLTIWTCAHTETCRHSLISNVLSLVSQLSPQDPPHQYLLWDVERLEKADFVRPANHSKLSCMLAKALRSLTSQRMSCGEINLSPRFPIRTSDSLPNAALHNKSEAHFTYSLEKTEGARLSNACLEKMVVIITILQHAIFPTFSFVRTLSYTYTGIIICIYFLLL